MVAQPLAVASKHPINNIARVVFLLMNLVGLLQGSGNFLICLVLAQRIDRRYNGGNPANQGDLQN